MKLKFLIRGILNENLTLRDLTLSDLESVASQIKMTGIDQLNADLPNAGEGLMRIDLNSPFAQDKLDYYKEKVVDKVDKRKAEQGKKDSILDAEVILNPDEVWFNKVMIDDEDFKAEKERSLSVKQSNLDESALYEAKMPNEEFEKVIFEYEFPSNENRLQLINIIKNYFGEPLSKGREDQYWSTYIPKLELEDFMSDAQDFNPYPTGDVIMANRFKPLTKELKDGDIIKFFDYTVSENDPPRAEGYLKPGFIQRNRSLMKWNGGAKEAWIDNSMIDKYYFYHGDISDIKGLMGGKKVDSDYVKIFFDDSILDSMNAEQEDELRKIITSHKGQLRYVFGKDRASGGQRYTLVPQDLADDFIQAAYDFGAYEAETERNIRLEDKALNEIRKIVREIINNVIK